MLTGPILCIPLLSCAVSTLSSLQFNRVRLFANSWSAAHQASLSITNSQSLLKLMSIESVMPSNHLNLCCPLLLLPSIFSSIRVFYNKSVLRIRWPKYWSFFSFSLSPSNEYSGLTSFRIDWFDLLAVQLWKIIKEMGIPDHLTCLLRNLHAGQEATVRTGHGTTDWFQVGEGVHQGCILSPCLFNLYAEYIMRNAGLD